jgi:GNAT superfamily N-acetyltransferase
MTGLTISVEGNPLPADLNVIENALVLHNEAKSAPRNYTPLTIFMRNAEGKIVGGLRGNTVWGWLFVSQLWATEVLRGQDYGTKLMDTAEREAQRRFKSDAITGRCGAPRIDFRGIRAAIENLERRLFDRGRAVDHCFGTS